MAHWTTKTAPGPGQAPSRPHRAIDWQAATLGDMKAHATHHGRLYTVRTHADGLTATEHDHKAGTVTRADGFPTLAAAKRWLEDLAAGHPAPPPVAAELRPASIKHRRKTARRSRGALLAQPLPREEV